MHYLSLNFLIRADDDDMPPYNMIYEYRWVTKDPFYSKDSEQRNIMNADASIQGTMGQLFFFDDMKMM